MPAWSFQYAIEVVLALETLLLMRHCLMSSPIIHVTEVNKKGFLKSNLTPHKQKEFCDESTKRVPQIKFQGQGNITGSPGEA